MYVISKDDNKEQLQKVLLAVKEELEDDRGGVDADLELDAVTRPSRLYQGPARTTRRGVD